MSELTVEQAIHLALDHQRAGQLAEAEEVFRQILDVYPDQADALHLLGAVYLEARRLDLAEARVSQAIHIRAEPAFKLTLALILRTTGRIAEAETLYRELLAAQPEMIDTYLHLAVLLNVAQRSTEAETVLEEALRRAPLHTMVQGHLGVVRCHLKKWNDAIPLLQAAIAATPHDADLFAALAAAYYALRQHEAALSASQSALAIDPQHPHASSVLAMASHALHRPPASLVAARHAATQLPNELRAQINYGESLRHAGKWDEAVAHYQACLQRRPDAADLHNNLANIFKDQGLLDDAIAAYQRAIAASPNPEPLYLSNLLYTLQYHREYTPQKILEASQQYEERIAKPLAAQRPQRPISPAPSPTPRRLRIGYLSSEFRQHTLGLYLYPLLTQHDRTQFEIFCYSTVTQPDFYTFRFRQCVDHWRDIQPDTPTAADDALADLIRNDQIDILVDLHLHMSGNRLPVFARRAAPVQLSFAGYPGTTGLGAIDFRLTDPHLEPPAATPLPASEKPLHIPTWWCYHPAIEIPVNDLPAARPATPFTFGNLNNFCKLNDATFALWAQIMQAVPRSQLLLLAAEGSHRDRTRACFQSHGIAADRIRFSPRLPTGDYYQLFHQIDLSLDSFPYNGHTTSLDSFFMGVPVTTIIGDRPVARATWSQLNNLDLTILAAKTEREFIDISIRLARDSAWLSALRRTLRDRMKQSPLMDAPAFARGIETAYRQAWQHLRRH